MADMAKEPSMEDILSSIRKIIAEDNAAAAAAVTASPARARGRAQPVADTADAHDVLELTENASVPVGEPILSPVAAAASLEALSSLSKLVVKPEVPGSDTLEGLVREMLKPLLKEWLDAHLPEIVERMVAQEVTRLTRQA